MPLTFPIGSAYGAKVCVPLTAVADNLVECDEDFMVVLDLLSSGTSISLGNNSTAVKLVDSDGMYALYRKDNEIVESNFLPVASFALSTMATVIEGEPLKMCAQMESAGATLGKEVVVTVSTVNGTGKNQKIRYIYILKVW